MLQQRFDSKYLIYAKGMNSMFKFDLVKFKQILIDRPMYGANESGYERTSRNQVRYIRITDIDEFGNLKTGLGATCENVDDKFAINDGDLLIARSGNTVGKSYIHSNNGEKCIFAGYMIKFIINKEIALPDYIFYYLQTVFFEKWKNSIMRVSGQPNINAQEYSNLDIPIPSLKIQNRIVSIMDNAYAIKKEKEEEAQRLLDSIDEYLLSELGINMPDEKENSLENRMFYTNSNIVLGGRFDPFYHKKDYIVLEKLISCTLYETSKILNIATIVSGVIYSSNDETEKGHRILRANNIDIRTNKLELKNIRHINDSIKIDKNKRLYKDDILMCTASGSKEHAGKVAYIDNDMDYYFGGFMSVIRIKSDSCQSKYLYEYLSSKLFNKLLNKYLGGTNINNVNSNMLNKIKIIIPDIEKQNKIIKEIDLVRKKALKLEVEAFEVVKNAKKQFETILLGGEI